MKLSEIEAYAYEVIYPDCDGELFFTIYLAKERAAEVGGDIRNLHTPEQMQEYAKAKVKELLFEQLWNDRLYANSKIFFDKEVEKICSSIFEEDTKND
ncbi:hypothetical protein [Lactococcus lactis]|uniref:hypothetical protein n=1 Tax=Lactococcus lactis TaxID=1358 RepID=UPI00240EEED6|nr:hypothetical protein [Lactococcus lactis]